MPNDRGSSARKSGVQGGQPLERIWAQPVNSNDATRAANSRPCSGLSSRPTLDKSSGIDAARFTRGPDAAATTDGAAERVVVPNRDAAEQAGYRAALIGHDFSMRRDTSGSVGVKESEDAGCEREERAERNFGAQNRDVGFSGSVAGSEPGPANFWGRRLSANAIPPIGAYYRSLLRTR